MSQNLTMPERLTRIETIVTEIKGLVLADIARINQLRAEHDELKFNLEVRAQVNEARAKDVENRMAKWSRGMKWGATVMSILVAIAGLLWKASPHN